MNNLNHQDVLLHNFEFSLPKFISLTICGLKHLKGYIGSVGSNCDQRGKSDHIFFKFPLQNKKTKNMTF